MKNYILYTKTLRGMLDELGYHAVLTKIKIRDMQLWKK